MAIYNKVVNGIVTESIVADADFFNTFIDTTPGTWIEAFKDANGEAAKR